MARLSLLVIVVLGLTAPGRGADADTHLFILSGQSNMAALRPEESFTPLVEEAFGTENVIVVKAAWGGQPIRRWYKQWQPGPECLPEVLAKPVPSGDLYDRLMAEVRKAVADRQVATVTFVWMQGERDAREQNGDVYAASLKGLIAQLRQDLGRADMNVVIGRLSDFDKYPHWNQVRVAQMAVADADPLVVWVDTDTMNDGLNRAGKTIRNNLHMSADGYVEMGRRFAEESIALVNKQLAVGGK